MLKFIVRRMLRRFERHYGYDASYMEEMLDHAPRAFFKFNGIVGLSHYRDVVPVDACFAAKLVGVLAEDCGPCTQLGVEMAREAGMSDDQIEAVLTADPGRMTGTTLLGYRFARAIVDRSDDEESCREAVREQWGAKGVIELTLACQVVRIFPMVKAGLGHGKACRRVLVAGRPVDVDRTMIAHAA
jgi:hypothetical protein